MDNNISELITIFSEKIINSQYEWNGRYFIIKHLDAPSFAKVTNVLTTLNVKINGDAEEISFDFNNDLGTGNLFFFEKIHFVSDNSYSRYKDYYQTVNLILLMANGNVINTVANAQINGQNNFVYNYIYYRKILSHLLSTPDFTSLHAENDSQFAILSAEKGAFFIGYNLSETRLDNQSRLDTAYDELLKCLPKIEFINFFKDVVINATHEHLVKERFLTLITSLSVCLSLAERDLQIYVRKFAFEKIKSKFKEEKVKYFESLEKNIESLNKQVLAFPLTFAASVFAGFQVKENWWILFVILIAYGLYTLVAWKILAIIHYNISTTEEDVTTEKRIIQSSYNFVYAEFEPDFNKITIKITMIKQLRIWLKRILLGLLVIFFTFAIVYSININNMSKKKAVVKVKEDSQRVVREKFQDSLLLQISKKFDNHNMEIVRMKNDSSLRNGTDTILNKK